MICPRLVLALAAATLLLPASAQATTIVGPGSPYQTWVDGANVPTPAVSLDVVVTESPCGVPSFGCTDGETHIDLAPEAGRGVFLHELGHVWDRHAMQDWQRGRFQALAHIKALPWNNPDPRPFTELAADEWFADAYSLCARLPAVVPAFRGGFITGDGFINYRPMRRVCRMIRLSP